MANENQSELCGVNTLTFVIIRSGIVTATTLFQ